MFSYQKRLIFPVYVEQPDHRYADILSEYYGGKEGKFISFTRYISQRPYFSNLSIRDLLGMIASEELSHMELIGAVIKKLGGSEHLTTSTMKITWGNHMERGNKDLVELLRLDQKAEIKSINNLRHDIECIYDSNVKRIFQFIIKRDEFHAALFKKTAEMLAQDVRNELYADLIHEYKMSLRVVD